MALEDYGALLRSGQATVPDFAAQEAQRQLLALKRQELGIQMAKAQEQINARNRFQAGLTALLAKPNATAEDYGRFLAENPDFAKEGKQVWDAMDAQRKEADFQEASEVWFAARNGKFDLATAKMRKRIEADRAAGQDVSDDEMILSGLESDNPVERQAATRMIGLHLSVADKDRFAAADKVFDEEKPTALQKDYEFIKSLNPALADQFIRNKAEGGPIIANNGDGTFTIIPRSSVPSGGGGAAEPSTSDSAAPLDMGAISSLASQFGKVTSTKRSPEHNKEVGGVPNSYHLKGQAIDIARKKGVSHGQIEAAMKKAGYQIIESLDEGDHSHFAFAGQSGPVRVRSVQEAMKLPKGTIFLTPDGRRKVR